MATTKWLGHADAVAHVMTGSIDSVDGTPADNTFTVTRNGKTVSQVGNTDVATTAAALVVLLNAEAEPEFSEITWANPSAGNITATSDTAGKPIPTITLTETGAGTGSVTDFSETTANSGPNCWDTAENWSEGSVPAASDVVIVENSDVPILYGLSDAGNTKTSLTVNANCGSNFYIGLPEVNEDDPDNTYEEDRTTYLTIDCTTINIGIGDGNGSQRIKIDSGTIETTLNVYKTSTSRKETGVPCLLWKGTHTDNDINVTRGDLGVAVFASETANFETMKVGWYDNPSGDALVYLGSGVTHKAGGTIDQTGGVITSWSNVITVSLVGGEFWVRGSATATTISVDEGTCYYASSGTLTTLNVSQGGTFDFRRDNQARTVTNCNRYEGGAIYDPLKTVTWTNGIDCVRCRFDDLIDCGHHRTWTPSAI